MTRRPNIVFVLTDDHASHAIGAYGSVVNRTPHLDALAESLATSVQALDVPAAPPPEEPTGTGQSSDLTACLSALRALKAPLEAADMSVIDEHEQWLQRHPAACGERFQVFNQCMESMDFPAAARACEVLLSDGEPG